MRKENIINVDSYKSNFINKNDNKILFVETLPLILGDYIQEHKEYALTNVSNSDDFFLEVNNLFDKEIISKFKEVKILKQAHLKKKNSVKRLNKVKSNIDIRQIDSFIIKNEEPKKDVN